MAILLKLVFSCAFWTETCFCWCVDLTETSTTFFFTWGDMSTLLYLVVVELGIYWRIKFLPYFATLQFLLWFMAHAFIVRDLLKNFGIIFFMLQGCLYILIECRVTMKRQYHGKHVL